MMTRYVAYLRVSSQRQGESGLGLDAQREQVERYVQSRGGRVTREFIEVESGKKSDRPQLALAMRYCQQTGCVLIVAKLDRLARDTKILLSLVDSTVRVAFCDLPDVATSDPTVGRLLLTVMAAVAEFEGRRISDRTKAALAARRRRGGALGAENQRCRNLNQAARAKGAQASAQKHRARTAEFYRDIAPWIYRQYDYRGRTYLQIAQALNRAGKPTQSGKPWAVSLVRSVLVRYKASRIESLHHDLATNRQAQTHSHQAAATPAAASAEHGPTEGHRMGLSALRAEGEGTSPGEAARARVGAGPAGMGSCRQGPHADIHGNDGSEDADDANAT